MIKCLLNIINFFIPKREYRWYRTDLNMWEDKFIFLNFIRYYKYSIWLRGKTIKKIKFLKIKNQIYIKEVIELGKLQVGKKEFKELYNNNKWLIPINKELNLELD